jgi:hypothetical protein
MVSDALPIHFDRSQAGRGSFSCVHLPFIK